MEAGMDMEMPKAIGYGEKLKEMFRSGQADTELLDRTVLRVLEAKFRMGLFEQPFAMDGESCKKIFEEKEGAELSLRSARESMVLLKNNGILPLDAKKLKNVAVIGPNADSHIALEGNYNGTSSRYVTFLEGIRAACGDTIRVNYSTGAHLYKRRSTDLAEQDDDRLAEAVAMAHISDVVILCLGLDSTIEGEAGDASNEYSSGDKPNLELPRSQRQLLDAVLMTGKPVITVVAAGSALRVEEGNAILWAWYPGQAGGTALADILFGKVSPSGKLPVTFYHSVDEIPKFEDYTMRGRTYRYFQGEALYPFGFGLSYTEFYYSNLAFDPQKLELSVSVRNGGNMECEEVVEAYIRDLDTKSHGLRWNLCAFGRVLLRPGEEKRVKLPLSAEAFTTVSDRGVRQKRGKHFRFWVGGSQPDAVSERLLGIAPVSLDVEME